jgi:hypothetical protein
MSERGLSCALLDIRANEAQRTIGASKQNRRDATSEAAA